MGKCHISLDDSLLRTRFLRRRHRCGSNEGRVYFGMDCDDERTKIT
jgi:hypothetical protein